MSIEKKSLISKPSEAKQANSTKSAKPSVSAPISARISSKVRAEVRANVVGRHRK